jgi:hypothetical protein
VEYVKLEVALRYQWLTNDQPILHGNQTRLSNHSNNLLGRFVAVALAADDQFSTLFAQHNAALRKGRPDRLIE